MPRSLIIILTATLALSCVPSAASTKKIVAPLPLDAATNVRSIEPRSEKTFSPAGDWVTLNYQIVPDTPDKTAGSSFNATGVPSTEGNNLRRIQLIHIQTGDSVELSDADSSSWGASWCPNGRRLAYYSDIGGETGVWVWDVDTRQSRRLGSVIARPYWAYEIPRWTDDGQRLLVKLLPKGLTLAEANKLLPSYSKMMKRSFPAPGDRKPSVVVLRSGGEASASSKDFNEGSANRSLADLALIDAGSGKVERLVVGRRVSNYTISPDQNHIAYVVPKGRMPNTQRAVFDLHIRTLTTGEDRQLSKEVPLDYGNEFSWSPDSKRIAYLSKSEHGKRRVLVLGLDGSRVEFSADLGDAMNSADVPLWDKAGDAVYMLGGGTLWRLDVRSAKVTQLGSLPDVQLTQLVARTDSNRPWQSDNKFWAFARDVKTSESLIVSIDPVTGDGRVALRGGDQAISGEASDVTDAGLISYVGSGPEHLPDLWLFDTRSGKRRQLSRLNAELERYALGETRRITWMSGRGEKLEGALILPPGYKPGQKLPTVVWVYGGRRTGPLLKQFGVGLTIPVFNPFVLTTRGYAFFYPDIPVRTGELMNDIYAAVMPGIDALVAQGYADPERLAVMGQSFGSYTAWSLLVQTNRFKAAITTANANPDLFANYLSMIPHNGDAPAIGFFEKGQGGMGGDPWTYPDRYLKNSPLFKLDKITTPLLMGQGNEDGDLRGSDAMFVALRRLGKEVEYRVYEHEGHGLMSRVNVIDFWKRRLDFLREHLGSQGIAADQAEISLHLP